jgi:hypothetical protein
VISLNIQKPINFLAKTILAASMHSGGAEATVLRNTEHMAPLNKGLQRDTVELAQIFPSQGNTGTFPQQGTGTFPQQGTTTQQGTGTATPLCQVYQQNIQQMFAYYNQRLQRYNSLEAQKLALSTQEAQLQQQEAALLTQLRGIAQQQGGAQNTSRLDNASVEGQRRLLNAQRSQIEQELGVIEGSRASIQQGLTTTRQEYDAALEEAESVCTENAETVEQLPEPGTSTGTGTITQPQQ